MADDRSLPIVFKTQTPYPIPSQKFMIPASWKRYQLSQLINKSLSLVKPIPFDFLIAGEVLRGTLAEWCLEKNFGMEETLEVEYIESVMPPQRVGGMPHDDWVSSVSCQIPGFFATASYDAQIRLFDAFQRPIHTIAGHSGPVTSMCILPSPTADTDTDTHLIASASHDLTACLTSVALGPDPADTARSAPVTLASLHLHTAPLSSICASPSGAHLLTASWDTLIGLWDTSIPAHDEVPLAQEERERKRQRKGGEGGGGSEAARPRRKAPVSVLKSHTARVTKAVFDRAAGAQAFSCGLDSTVRTWDVESGVCTNTMAASEKPFLDLVLNSDGRTALAASTDRTITAYDARMSSSSPTAPSVASFTQPATPSCLAAAPTHAQQFVSGGYDGVVRLWDLRSAKSAVASFQYSDKSGKKGAGGKVLAVDWGRGGVVGVGGESGLLDVWRVGEEQAIQP